VAGALQDTLYFESFQLDPGDRLLREGEHVPLPPKETALLRLLAAAQGRVVSKDEILDRIWPGEQVSETSLTRCVHSLRKLLGERGRRGGSIETVHGRGYRFSLPVERVSPELDRRVRVAVVPFDAEGRGGQRYLAQGLAADVTTRLGLLSSQGIAPLARQSAQRFQRHRSDPLPLARHLDLDFLVTGRLRAKGGQLGVVVEVVRVRDEVLQWSNAFSGPEDAAEQLASKIAEALAKGIGRQVPAAATPPPHATDPRAYRALLQGDFASQIRTERGLRRAIDCYRRALGWDPRCASAHAALAQALLYLGVRGYAAPLEVAPEARSALATALDLDDRNPLALSALAHLRWAIDWKPDAALELVDRGERVAPNDDQLPFRRSQILLSLGRFDEALAAQRASLGRNPFAPNTLASHGQAHYFAGNDEDALSVARMLAANEPEFAMVHGLRAQTAAATGRREEAIAAAGLADMVARGDQLARSTAAHALATLGMRAEARAALAALERCARRRYVSGTFLAIVHAGLGDPSAALACLERAVAQRCMWLPFAAFDPRFAPLREAPRFREIAALVTGGAVRIA
jgi:DNA-binding winged helix-turn-helix (wHTH) protein/tetratricopeptide (TPR) repeat protein